MKARLTRMIAVWARRKDARSGSEARGGEYPSGPRRVLLLETGLVGPE